MKIHSKLPMSILLLTPAAAFAQGAPHIIEALYAFGGGAAGGFFGALLACWLCKRFGSRNNTDTKRR